MDRRRGSRWRHFPPRGPLEGDRERLRELEERDEIEDDKDRLRRRTGEGDLWGCPCFNLPFQDRCCLMKGIDSVRRENVELFLGAEGGTEERFDEGGNSGPSGRRADVGLGGIIATAVGSPVGATKTDRVIDISDDMARGAEGTVIF